MRWFTTLNAYLIVNLQNSSDTRTVREIHQFQFQLQFDKDIMVLYIVIVLSGKYRIEESQRQYERV